MNRIMKSWGVALYMCCFPLLLAAQVKSTVQNNRNTTHATLFGVGHDNVYDTYLSPLEYKGTHLQVVHETIRPTHWLEGRISTQGVFKGGASLTDNATNNASAWAFELSYGQAWHYNWTLPRKLRLMAGLQLKGVVGAIYNTRNGNNPVNARAQLHLSPSFLAIYPFHIKRQCFTVQYQLSAPIMGMAFSPRYGQSYYEMSQGNYDHNICFIHPVNSPSMRHFVALDFPIANYTFRLGYEANIQQMEVNRLRQHLWTHSFLIGYVKHFSFVKRSDKKYNGFIL